MNRPPDSAPDGVGSAFAHINAAPPAAADNPHAKPAVRAVDLQRLESLIVGENDGGNLYEPRPAGGPGRRAAGRLAP